MTEDYEQTKARLYREWMAERDRESKKEAAIMLFCILGILGVFVLMCLVFGEAAT